MQPIYWIIVGYLIGLATAIAWSHIEVWARRDPRTKISNLLLVLMGWFMVPLALIGFIGYACVSTISRLLGKKT